IVLATTTSTRDSGLLDSLLPVFEAKTGLKVRVVAVGTGQALAMARRGDAEVVLVHAPDAERALVDSGYFVRRRLVMHNDFLIVGAAEDPAKLQGLHDQRSRDVPRLAAQAAAHCPRRRGFAPLQRLPRNGSPARRHSRARARGFLRLARGSRTHREIRDEPVWKGALCSGRRKTGSL